MPSLLEDVNVLYKHTTVEEMFHTLRLPVQFLLFLSSVNPFLQEHISEVRLVDVLVSRTHSCSQTLLAEQFLFGSTEERETMDNTYEKNRGGKVEE